MTKITHHEELTNEAVRDLVGKAGRNHSSQMHLGDRQRFRQALVDRVEKSQAELKAFDANLPQGDLHVSGDEDVGLGGEGRHQQIEPRNQDDRGQDPAPERHAPQKMGESSGRTGLEDILGVPQHRLKSGVLHHDLVRWPSRVSRLQLEVKLARHDAHGSDLGDCGLPQLPRARDKVQRTVAELHGSRNRPRIVAVVVSGRKTLRHINLPGNHRAPYACASPPAISSR